MTKNDFMLPQDRRTVNAWSRHYYSVNPVIANWIDTIVECVYSNFKLVGENKKELGIYNREMFEEKLVNNEFKFKHEQVAKSALKEFNVIGETFIYEEIEDRLDDGNFIILNPDYVEIKQDMSTDGKAVSVIPDEELLRLVKSSKKEDVKLRKSLGIELVRMIKSNKNIPLYPRCLTTWQNIHSAYDVRGTSNLMRYFKVLLMDDQARELFYEKQIVMKKEDVLGSIYHIVKSESKSDAFIKGLQRQRERLEAWIIEKRLKRIQKQHDLKTLPNISWNKNVTKEYFEYIGKF